MRKTGTTLPPLYRMRPLEASDARAVSGYLAEALSEEFGAEINPGELESALNLAIDSATMKSSRFWIVERLGAPMVIASGPSRGKGGEGFDFVVWLNSSSPPLKEALLRFWLEKWAPSEPCSVTSFCRANGLLPSWLEGEAAPKRRSRP